MRIKILLIGDDPASLVSDGQLLRERGLLVFTSFNPQNIGDLVDEIKPDVVFFDPDKQSNQITDAYNNFVNDINFTNIPVIFTLSDDDVYLVTRKRTSSKGEENQHCRQYNQCNQSSIAGNQSACEKKYQITSSRIRAKRHRYECVADAISSFR